MDAHLTSMKPRSLTFITQNNPCRQWDLVAEQKVEHSNKTKIFIFKNRCRYQGGQHIFRLGPHEIEQTLDCTYRGLRDKARRTLHKKTNSYEIPLNLDTNINISERTSCPSWQ